MKSIAEIPKVPACIDVSSTGDSLNVWCNKCQRPVDEATIDVRFGTEEYSDHPFGPTYVKHNGVQTYRLIVKCHGEEFATEYEKNNAPHRNRCA